MIDILNRTNLFDILSRLRSDESPVFGGMTAQHMVEHLAFAVRFSNGREPQQHYYSPEKEAKIKAFVIDTDKDFVVGFRSPVLPADGLPTLKHTNLENAVENLKMELNHFDDYFVAYPDEKPINPSLGELNYKEWVRFHNRHFTHHFKQFRLV